MKLQMLRSKLMRLQTAFDPRLSLVTLTTGERLLLSWDELMRGCCDVASKKMDTREARIVLNYSGSDSEWIEKNVSMLRAIRSPIQT